MNYKDTWATDEDGNKFVFTVEMKRSLAKADLPIEVDSLGELGHSPATTNNNSGSADSYSHSTAESAPTEPEIIQIDPETGKYIGSLKWYNASRGYGFISRGAGEDIFFHKTSTIGDPADIAEGQSVLYDVEERNKGPEATEVEPYDG
jgi:CspA family cold shock protein